MSWQEVSFDALYSEDSRNGIYKTKEFHGSGVRVVNMGELFGYDRIADQAMSLVQLTDHKMEKSSLLDGDLLFGRRSIVEEGAGKCSLVFKPTRPMTFESSIIRVRLNQESADPQFYYYYFKSYIGRSRVMAIVNGVTVKGIRGSELKKIFVHHPPLKVQVKIRDILSVYDDLIAANQRRIQLLEESARLLYREWFVKLRFPGHETVAVFDGVPEGWEKKTLGDICDSIGGGTPSTAHPEYWGGDITWITPTDVTHNDCLVLLDSEKKISESGLQNSSAKMVPAETILMTSRASIGFFALINKPVCTNQGFISIVPWQEEARMFLLMHLQERVDEIKSIATGSTFKEITKKSFRNLPILWPTEKVLQQFNNLAYPNIHQIRNIKTQNELLKQARDLLLPKLMSGALDVSRLSPPP